MFGWGGRQEVRVTGRKVEWLLTSSGMPVFIALGLEESRRTRELPCQLWREECWQSGELVCSGMSDYLVKGGEPL